LQEDLKLVAVPIRGGKTVMLASESFATAIKKNAATPHLHFHCTMSGVKKA